MTVTISDSHAPETPTRELLGRLPHARKLLRCEPGSTSAGSAQSKASKQYKYVYKKIAYVLAAYLFVYICIIYVRVCARTKHVGILSIAGILSDFWNSDPPLPSQNRLSSDIIVRRRQASQHCIESMPIACTPAPVMQTQ